MFVVNNILMDEGILAKKISKDYLEAVKPGDNRKIILFGCDKESLKYLGSHIDKYISEKRKNIEIFVGKELSQRELLEKTGEYVIDVGWLLKHHFKTS